MAKWGVSYACGGKAGGAKRVVRWRVIDFSGRGGGESRGIVDAIAVRKDHRDHGKGLKRGDLLEIVLLQIKGGAASMPSSKDISRLRKVKSAHAAAEVVLVRWSRQKHFKYYRLKSHPLPPQYAWDDVTPATIFGPRVRRQIKNAAVRRPLLRGRQRTSIA